MSNKKIKKILREIGKLTEEEQMIFYRFLCERFYFSFANKLIDEIIKGETNDN